VAWWFEAHLDADGSEPFPPLTNVPVFLREGDRGGGTHWHQAVAALPPLRPRPGGAACLEVRTDGKKISWFVEEVDGTDYKPEAVPAEPLREAWLDAARNAEELAQKTLWQAQRTATEAGDAPRVAALRAAAMHVGAQPGLFGVFGGSSVASHVLKEFFGAGCSAGF